jgi:hypothetical protein
MDKDIVIGGGGGQDVACWAGTDLLVALQLSETPLLEGTVLRIDC